MKKIKKKDDKDSIKKRYSQWISIYVKKKLEFYLSKVKDH